MINGLSWPATERLTYARGEVARWRVINLSSQVHPMHLHGFYFRVLRIGDGRLDEPVARGEGQLVVTQLLRSGGTMTLEWTAEREGNWLFHCHIMAHVSPDRRLAAAAHAAHADAGHGAHASSSDPSLGMAGMVLGITVLPSSSAPAEARSAKRPRQLTMIVGREEGSSPDGRAIGVAIDEYDNAQYEAAAPLK
jgi:hypothetical protein